MAEYRVLIEINGKPTYVGCLCGDNQGNTTFSYSQDYLNSENPYPISISLPIQSMPFSAIRTKNFFDGLLPEGFTRQTLAARIREDADNYIGILRVIGQECIGAIMINAEPARTEPKYQAIGQDLLNALASKGASAATDVLSTTHLSLTGASGKVGLYFNEKNRLWYLPSATAPSTHIIKQSHVRLKDIVINEALCMDIARRCGLDVPETEILSTNNANDGSILFVSKRFDRYIDACADSGFSIVHRLHQEDFAQALSIASTDKYEKNDGHYFARMFDLVEYNSANPLEDKLILFKAIAFNCLIGNNDAHLKNFSLLYSKDLRSKRLAPLYDLICTRYYSDSDTDFAISINGKYNNSVISYNDFIEAAQQVGISSRIAERELDDLCSKFEKAVNEAKSFQTSKGYSQASNIAECILLNAKDMLK